jgi:hypothetical protein
VDPGDVYTLTRRFDFHAQIPLWMDAAPPAINVRDMPVYDLARVRT